MFTAFRPEFAKAVSNKVLPTSHVPSDRLAWATVIAFSGLARDRVQRVEIHFGISLFVSTVHEFVLKHHANMSRVHQRLVCSL